MDTSSHHYHTSILKKFNPNWWNAEVSWKNKYVNGDPSLGFRKIWKNINYPVQLTDCWHFFKTLMIIFLTLSVVTFDSDLIVESYYYLLYVGLYGTVWNVVFSLFYDKILR
jgi:hypothetical protein